jgi:hypothetical protein
MAEVGWSGELQSFLNQTKRRLVLGGGRYAHREHKRSEDDLSRLVEQAAKGEPLSLVKVVAVDAPSPRRVSRRPAR